MLANIAWISAGSLSAKKAASFEMFGSMVVFGEVGRLECFEFKREKEGEFGGVMNEMKIDPIYRSRKNMVVGVFLIFYNKGIKKTK